MIISTHENLWISSVFWSSSVRMDFYNCNSRTNKY